jgi:uncharacterized protein
VNHVDAFDLRLADPRPAKDKARALAMRAAREKAQALAREVGQTIGKAIAVTEDVEDPWRNLASNSFNNAMAFDGDGGGGGSFAAGLNVVRARVTARFELQ